jgi:hypothetical protein
LNPGARPGSIKQRIDAGLWFDRPAQAGLEQPLLDHDTGADCLGRRQHVDRRPADCLGRSDLQSGEPANRVGDQIYNPTGQQIVWGDQVYNPSGQQIGLG